MQPARTLEEIIEVVKRPLPLEIKNGYDNRSATVGFGPYVVKWLSEARSVLSSAEEKNSIDELISLFSRYGTLDRSKREKLVRDLSAKLSFPAVGRERPKKPCPVSSLDSPVQYIKGVGPKLAKLFGNLNVHKVRDLIFFFPRDYEDRRSITPISKIDPDNIYLARGTITRVSVKNTRRGFSIIKAAVADSTGVIFAVWFNQPFLKNVLKKGMRVLVSGKASFNSYTAEMELSVRDFELLEEGEEGLTGLLPKYPLTEGLFQKKVRSIIERVIAENLDQIDEYLSDEIRRRYSLVRLKDAIRSLHFPSSPEETKKAYLRIAFDDFFLLQLGLLRRRKIFKERARGRSFSFQSGFAERFAASLPFELTGAQKKVFEEIKRDMMSERPMSRLIQGDVGSGKTVIAAMAMVEAAAGKVQSAIMAPTEILAQQHFSKISSLVGPIGVKTALLLGGTKDKQKILAGLKSGSTDIVVGTHALIEESVKFRDLGLIVIDEQHRFGVLQRAALAEKGNNPDIMVMTATPIPRSLSLVLFGDLDRSVIDELPPGRIPAETLFIPSSDMNKAHELIRREVGAGRQAFVVCPLIDESEKTDLKAAKLEFENLKKVFPEFAVDLLHGRMKGSEKDAVMQKFKDNRTQILVSTTVIEVGIDIPNATVMLIQHAERFGLSQLHQLRGRIGRGGDRSYCILSGDPGSAESKARVSAMLKSNDGFYIAEQDLKLRGPGEFCGTRQAGLPTLRIADIIADAKILDLARSAAEDILLRDPDLEAQGNLSLKKELFSRYGEFLELKTVN